MAEIKLTPTRVTHAWNVDASWNWGVTWLSVSGNYHVTDDGLDRWETYVSAIEFTTNQDIYCTQISVCIPIKEARPYNVRAIFSNTEKQPNTISISSAGTTPVDDQGNAFTQYVSSGNAYFNIAINEQLKKNTTYYIYVYPKDFQTSSFFWGQQYAGSGITLTFTYKEPVKLTLNISNGVEAFTSRSYDYYKGDNAQTTATAKTGYRLTKYVGTNADGTDNNITWEINNKPQSEVTTWLMNADRTITVYAEPYGTVSIYTNEGWKQAIPYIYTGVAANDGWQQAIPYVYKNSTEGWKQAGG